MQIRAAVVEGIGALFELQDVELAEPARGEVLVRIVASGLCHTDAITRDGDLPLPLPGILGHEGAGVVERVGEGVTTVAAGDAVVIGWPSCGACRNCLEGQPRYCLRTGEALVSGRRFKGGGAGTSAYARPDGSELSGHFFGQSSCATHSIVLADALVKAPDDVPLELLGALACGLGTGAGAVLNEARPDPGSSLVVFGAGAVGLAAIMAARCIAATTIIAVDLHGSRLELATRYGATHTIDPCRTDVVEEAGRITGGAADYAFECTGAVPVVEQAAECVGMLGTLVLIGGAPAQARFSLDHMHTLWGKRIVGVLGGGSRSGTFIPALIELHKQGRFPFDELVRFYGLDEIERALADSRSCEVLKPVVRMPE